MLTQNLMGDPKLIMGSEHLHPPARLFQVIALLYFSPNYQLSRRKVGSLIWDTKDEKTALANLRQFLFRVSKYEPIARIIQFDQQDVFSDLATARIDVSLLSESAVTLDRLIEFWKGPFLDEDQPQSEAYQDWLFAKRQDIEDAYFRLTQGSLNLETFPGLATPQDVGRVEQTLISIHPMRMQTYHSSAEAYGQLGAMSEIYRIRDMYRSKGHEDDTKLSQIIRRWANAKPINDDPILNFAPTLPTVAIIVQKGGFDHMRIAPFAMDLVASLARYRSFKTLAPSVKASGWLIGDQQTNTREFDDALVLYQSPASIDQHTIGINLVQMYDRNIIWSGQFNLGQFGINDRVKRILEQIT
jgi:DNA-binding SARP family transcriptional activator